MRKPEPFGTELAELAIKPELDEPELIFGSMEIPSL